MENLNEPEEQTTSDNFDVSANEQDFLRAQSCWGELNADDKKYLEKKGQISPQDLLHSYRELEKAYSSKISIPKDGDKEAFQKLYSRLGMPDDVAGFEIQFSDEDMAWKDDFKQACLDNCILPKSAQAIYDWFVKNRAEQTDKFEEEKLHCSYNEMLEQQKEWGTQAELKTELMKRGIRLFAGNDDETVEALEQALGTRRMMQLFSSLGEAISEDNPVSFGGVNAKQKGFNMEDYFREMFNDYA